MHRLPAAVVERVQELSDGRLLEVRPAAIGLLNGPGPASGAAAAVIGFYCEWIQNRASVANKLAGRDEAIVRASALLRLLEADTLCLHRVPRLQRGSCPRAGARHAGRSVEA